MPPPYPFFFQSYHPTSFDKSYSTREVDKHDVEFIYWDTSGIIHKRRIRHRGYCTPICRLLAFYSRNKRIRSER